MSFLSPAYAKHVEKYLQQKRVIEARAIKLAAEIKARIDADPDRLILLDMIASTLIANWVVEVGKMEVEADAELTLEEAREKVLLLKAAQVAKLAVPDDPKHNPKQRPFCCAVHTFERMIEGLCEMLPDDADTALKLSDLMCDVVMSQRRPDRYFLLDEVLDKLAKRQRRACYKMAYGKEEGEKLAIEHELGLKAEKPKV